MGHLAEGIIAESSFVPLTRSQVCSRISESGIIPSLRLNNDEETAYLATTLADAGVIAFEVSVTFPGYLGLISRLASSLSNMIVGAGNVLDIQTARQSLKAGAHFLVSDGFIPDLVAFAAENEVTVISGALTPGEIIAAWQAGSDFIKVFPCDAMGGASYINSLKTALPHIKLIAAGGVDQQTAADFMKAGATALAIGKELVPREAIRQRQTPRIHELVRRVLTSIDSVVL
jgi:2-dehydro-3-deoxyphosphogluconate aldolase/(4S)-4-hydroxy-2-oxoglutarate aldolase